MSCAPGKPCHEGVKRRRALAVLGLMALIFVLLSAFSFLDSRGQATPTAIRYADFDAVEGKRIFQAYNCMGCHAIVGNGAYLGPDLTDTYERAGPAWIAAFLPSAGAWPTRMAVQLQLQNDAVAADAGVESIDAYLEKFPGAAERVARRGGQRTLMPNLPFRPGEVEKLIAFLKYTSAMNTEGWPPVPKVDGLTFPQAVPMPVALTQAVAIPAATATAGETPASPAQASGDGTSGDEAHAMAAAPATAEPVAVSPAAEIAHGEELVKQFGCTACHATTDQRLVGPGWGGLYGSTVTLADGSQATIDDWYLTESIIDPDAQIAEGFPAGMMPSFEALVDADQLAAMVAYIRSLGEK